jgi:phage protein D
MTSKPWLKYRRNNLYKVVFPTLPSLTVAPNDVDLYQERGSHDILELSFSRSSSFWDTLLKTGTPVIFSWTQGTRQKSWTGYVSHVSSQNTAQLIQTMKVVCIGASYVLKERASRAWKDKTIPEVASLIAKQFNLKFVSEPSTKRFQQLSMAGESYWTWLQEHAIKIGYVLYVENTTMHFRPLNKLLKASVSSAASFSLELPSTAANSLAYDRTLDSFVVEKGDYFDRAERPYTTRRTAGVHPLTGKKIGSVSSPRNNSPNTTRRNTSAPIFSDYSDEVITSSSFSRVTANALTSATRFIIAAKARGQGDPRAAPNTAVYIQGTGADTDGYWAVKKVHHSMNITGIYEVSLDLLTDGIGQNTSSIFRKVKSLNDSIIDVDELVLDALRGSSGPGSSVLTQKIPALKESGQGFGNTNILWRGN